MISIFQATKRDISIIQDIAHRTWPITYGSILSKPQLDYMMNLMYSEVSLMKQLESNTLFFLAYEGDLCLGFVSCEPNYLNNTLTRIHKIYILPDAQGKGVGKAVINIVIAIAKQNQSEVISLNVNKLNKAVFFYKKLGFEIVSEEVLDIGNGFFMDDYVMELKL